MADTPGALYDAVLARVRRKIADSSLTQLELGRGLGMKQSSVSCLLGGKNKLSLEQFLNLCRLVGASPHQLLAEADARFAVRRPATPAEEEALLASALHLLVYSAAVLPRPRAAFGLPALGPRALEAVFRELVGAGLLLREGNRYRRREASVTVLPRGAEGRRRRQAFLQEIHRLAQATWARREGDAAHRAKAINSTYLCHLTRRQAREIRELLRRVESRLAEFERANAAAGYRTRPDHPEPWLLHSFFAPPFESEATGTR